MALGRHGRLIAKHARRQHGLVFRVERDLAELLPIVDRRLLGHELVDAQAALHEVSASGERRSGYTHVAQHVALDAHELGEFAVRLVDFASASPKARRHAHNAKDAIVV